MTTPSTTKRQRLDLALVARGLCESREQAKRYIMAGQVDVNAQRAAKPSDLVDAGDELTLREPEKYVSRGGFKLEHALAHFDVTGETRENRVGIWVTRPAGVMGYPPYGEDKIGALGVRMRKWIAFHGVALNIMPDLEHYTGIIPCGVSQYGVTSLRALGKEADMATVDTILKQEFEKVFSVTLTEESLADEG